MNMIKITDFAPLSGWMRVEWAKGYFVWDRFSVWGHRWGAGERQGDFGFNFHKPNFSDFFWKEYWPTVKNTRYSFTFIVFTVFFDIFD